MATPELLCPLAAAVLRSAWTGQSPVTTRTAGWLETVFDALRLHGRARARVFSHDEQSHQNCADQHHHSDVEAGVEGMVSGGGPEQA